MKSHVQVAVIGGGVVGCSVLYHLTKLGWRDVVLIERSELTSGSTWHAAGGFHTLNADPNMAALQGYTIQLYRELEEISGQSCGLPPLSAKVTKIKKSDEAKQTFPLTRKSTLSNSGMRVMEQKPFESASSKFFSPPSESINTEQVD